MIIGTGIDMVHIPRIESMLDRWGERFLDRIFRTEERVYAEKNANPAISFAGFFAAREAAVKALGTGFSGGTGFRDVWVRHNRAGRPELVLCGAALEHAEKAGVSASHLSISHDADFAIALVIMEAIQLV